MTAFLRRYYAGGGTTTTLASSMSASDTSFTISSATGWPGSPGSDFIVVVDRATSSEEKILCSSNSSTTVTVATRGYDGTSATTHNASATVSLCGGAIDFDEANQVTNLLGNAAEGSLFYGKGAGVLPAKLAVGTAGQLLGNNGTDPTWLTALAEGSIHYGKGTTTAPAALAIGTAGYVLTAGASDPAWAAPITGTYASSNGTGTNVTLPSNTPTKLFDTASLAAGTWLVTMNAVVSFDGTQYAVISGAAAVDTATATLTGQTYSEVDDNVGRSGSKGNINLAFVAVVTAAGTLKMTGDNTGAGNAFALSGFSGYVGYTATRLA